MKPHGENAVLHTGYQLGTVYRSEAVVDDGSRAPDPTLGEYRETTIPGTRAPHVWLRGADARTVSIIDMFGGRFVAVVSEHADTWRQAAREVESRFGVAITVLDLSGRGEYTPDEPKFSRLYRGEKGHSMVLVRPDSYIAGRFCGDTHANASGFLVDCMRRILCLEDAGPPREAIATESAANTAQFA